MQRGYEKLSGCIDIDTQVQKKVRLHICIIFTYGFKNKEKIGTAISKFSVYTEHLVILIDFFPLTETPRLKVF